jgi:hypothetical protein
MPTPHPPNLPLASTFFWEAPPFTSLEFTYERLYYNLVWQTSAHELRTAQRRGGIDDWRHNNSWKQPDRPLSAATALSAKHVGSEACCTDNPDDYPCNRKDAPLGRLGQTLFLQLDHIRIGDCRRALCGCRLYSTRSSPVTRCFMSGA